MVLSSTKLFDLCRKPIAFLLDVNDVDFGISCP